MRDKKKQDGRLTLILTRGIGRAFVESGVEPAEVEAFLAHFS
jgi:3-dehydroquinate synthase